MSWRILLDTNIIIHRENHRVTNYSIGHLFRWLDKLQCKKIIHPYTVDEINSFGDEDRRHLLEIKLQSYEVLKTIKKPDEAFLQIIGSNDKSANDDIDNCLLYEVHLGRVDALITEDKRLRKKAMMLGIENKVLSIDEFLFIVTNAYPELVDYEFLSVKKTYFGQLDIDDPFFDSLKASYPGFVQWFNRKCDESVYMCEDNGSLLGLLYLKVEGHEENYNDITPTFIPQRRLKIGTFKVVSTGFRLGERFLKIIFDNAFNSHVDEIYVTMFDEAEDVQTLRTLLLDWGFKEYGHKDLGDRRELVLVKEMNSYDTNMSMKENYPNLYKDRPKYILPIFSQYHTTLFPDSQLKTEKREDFSAKLPHRYALEKVYISLSKERNIHEGDLLVFYRPGNYGSNKKYTSVLTTVGVVKEVCYGFENKEEFLKHCKNRSVFSKAELEKFWNESRDSIMVVKFIYVASLRKRLPLQYLWDKGIIRFPSGPRPFTKLTNIEFDMILEDSSTEINFIE